MTHIAHPRAGCKECNTRPADSREPPDAACIKAGDLYLDRAIRRYAAGDRCLDLTIRSYATAILSDAQIARRLGAAGIELPPSDQLLPTSRDADPPYVGLLVDRFSEPSEPLDARRWRAEQAAIALARHCAGIDEPARQIVARLCSLSAVPGWPDAAQIVAIVRAAIHNMHGGDDE
jgi:hypothetical protein